MLINPRLSIVSVTAILVVAALAGCAPATAPGSASSGAASVAPSTAPSKAATRSGGAMSALPAHCPTGALVSSKLGNSAPDPTESGDSVSLNCAYDGTTTANALSINFTTAKKLTPDEAEASLKAQGSTPAFSKVPGVGDFAFYDQVLTDGGTGSYITAASGPVAFHIVVPGSETKQQLIDLANAIIAGQ
jgi:hypothetical protein